jgi:hypothetical protein
MDGANSWATAATRRRRVRPWCFRRLRRGFISAMRQMNTGEYQWGRSHVIALRRPAFSEILLRYSPNMIVNMSPTIRLPSIRGELIPESDRDSEHPNAKSWAGTGRAELHLHKAEYLYHSYP